MATIIETKQSLISAKDILLNASLPLKTDSYAPVPHKDVIEFTLENLDKANFKVIEEKYSTARDGQQGMGFYNIQTPDPEMCIRLIWHNSYDKTMPLRWAMGANVIVCTNGMVRGEMGAFKRRHTGTVLSDYTENISQYISQAGDRFDALVRDRERMKEIELTKRNCAELVGRMFIEEAVINATQVGIIKREIENPSFNYNSDGSLWQFYNHCTVAFKEAHPRHFLDHHTMLHNFVEREFELV